MPILGIENPFQEFGRILPRARQQPLMGAPPITPRHRPLHALVLRGRDHGTPVAVYIGQADGGSQHLHEIGMVDEWTLASLREAVADADRHVKGSAIQALADRCEAEATEARHQALHDPAVRGAVIERVSPQGQRLALLQEALADEDLCRATRALGM